ncbi:IclR family transcriptional regulator [Rhizobium sp. Leaf262]|uniref:IclR family transcriptional regulator n=1 Tax=Rhizobium sp. Leaf262 TaxID=1736312 RepID=UPI000712C0AB|nr:IclR family transcriptional regulator [Rhizobium sp. Leaf262]KQO78857.1 IclR family transcriptional regulator [Rhizobium sp. Leaf262]
MAGVDDRRTGESTTGTLGKAISLLELVVMSPQPPRFTDILQRCGQPRGSLHRQLAHLLEEGLLEQRGDQTYVAGIRLLTFASQAWSGSDIRSVAVPHLRLLHEKTQESVHLGILRGAEIVYLDKLDGKHAVRMHSQIGRVSPAHCTGVGKAALSLLTESELEGALLRMVFQPYTANTITSPHRLRQEVEAIRKQGYGFDLEEHEVGIQCIAVPVSAPGRRIHAAISVTGPAYRLTRERLESWSALIIEAARNISCELTVRLPPSHE